MAMGAINAGVDMITIAGSGLAQQASADALRGIVMLVSLLPATALLAGFVAMFFYRVDDRLERQMRDELRSRRADV